MTETFELVKQLYKDYGGQPFEMSEGQNILFDLIFKRMYPRNHVMTYTQYGKSETTSMGVLTRASTFPEKWTIIGANEKKAKIIMNYAIGHIFDNPYTLKRFEIGRDESLERIRRERSKNRITFKLENNRIGEMLILSAEAHKQKDFEKALTGFGSPNIVLDDAPLIPNNIYGIVLRMMGGMKDNFLVKIGNPYKRNHFLKSFRNPKYHKFVIDWKQGVKENRITEEFVEEMRDELSPEMFGILYDCVFPEADVIDEQGYMPLITEPELDRARTKQEMFHFGQRRVGCDVAGGGKNYSVLLIRSRNYAEVVLKNRNPDTMMLAGQAIEVKKRLGRDETRKLASIYIDKIGIGKGVYDRVLEQTPDVIGVVGGEQATDKLRFFNKKAENYWRLREWILGGGKLQNREDWNQLLDIKYKIMSDRKIKIIGKEELLKMGISSPDVADALANTFNAIEELPSQVDDIISEIKDKDIDPYYR